MMEKPDLNQRIALVVILAIGYAILILYVISSFRTQARLTQQVSATEAAVAQAASIQAGDIASLNASLTTEKQRLADLQQKVPSQVSSDVFERVAVDAQISGVTDVRYQRKSETTETMQAGIYRVYRYSVSARGSEQQLLSFASVLQQQAGPTTQLDNLILNPTTDGDWLMSAEILIYTRQR
jgi:hypothetical protein